MEGYVALLAQALRLDHAGVTVSDKLVAIAIAAALHWTVFWGAKPLLFFLVPVLRSKSRKDQLSAMVRVPSLLNCALVVPVAFHLLRTDRALDADRFFGSSTGGNVLMALAAGFFVFDLTHSMFDFQGLPFLVHAVLCSAVYCLALTLPYVQYFGCVYLLFELSTVWLNAMWFVKFVYGLPEKSLVYRVCAAAFALTFFASRIVFGKYSNYVFYRELLLRYHEQHAPVTALFVFANVALTVLNHYWFYRVISVIVMGKAIKKEEIAGKE